MKTKEINKNDTMNFAAIVAIKNDSDTMLDTLTEYKEGGETFDGYMGAIGWNGANSCKWLYGSELSAAIRDHIKHYNIKGVTISCKTYSGGQTIKATFKASADDFRTADEILAEINPKNYIHDSAYWYTNTDGKSTHRDNAYNESDADAHAIAKRMIESRIGYYFGKYGGQINEYHIGDNNEMKPAFLEKIKAVKRIIDSYHYDNSNSMVDYFDTNFYANYTVKAV